MYLQTPIALVNKQFNNKYLISFVLKFGVWQETKAVKLLHLRCVPAIKRMRARHLYLCQTDGTIVIYWYLWWLNLLHLKNWFLPISIVLLHYMRSNKIATGFSSWLMRLLTPAISRVSEDERHKLNWYHNPHRLTSAEYPLQAHLLHVANACILLINRTRI